MCFYPLRTIWQQFALYHFNTDILQNHKTLQTGSKPFEMRLSPHQHNCITLQSYGIISLEGHVRSEPVGNA